MTTVTTISTTDGSQQIPASTFGDEEHPTFADFEHYLVHIPKSGGSFVFDKLLDMTVDAPSWKEANQKSFWRTLLGGLRGSRTTPNTTLPCDARTLQTELFETHYPAHSRMRKYSQYKCNLWMAEQPYTEKARHNYILVRNPKAHVISQYFHCRESVNHYKHWKDMPTLEGWLEAWVDAMDHPSQKVDKDLYNRFHCYDPRNLQSRYAGIVDIETAKGGAISATSEESILPVTDLMSLKEDLQRRFTVVGDNSRMTESICMIYLMYSSSDTEGTSLPHVPPQCDCTASSTESSSSSTQDQVTSEERQNHRQLKIHFYGHGVRHHGNSFETTPREDELLAALTKYDEPLYEAAQALFQTQVEEFQKKYGIQLCTGKL